jgi:hypothetical protein
VVPESVSSALIFFGLQAVGHDRQQPLQVGCQGVPFLRGEGPIGQLIVDILRCFIQAPDHLPASHVPRGHH